MKGYLICNDVTRRDTQSATTARNAAKIARDISKSAGRATVYAPHIKSDGPAAIYEAGRSVYSAPNVPARLTS